MLASVAGGLLREELRLGGRRIESLNRDLHFIGDHDQDLALALALAKIQSVRRGARD